MSDPTRVVPLGKGPWEVIEYRDEQHILREGTRDLHDIEGLCPCTPRCELVTGLDGKERALIIHTDYLH